MTALAATLDVHPAAMAPPPVARAGPLHGFGVLVARRIRVTTKTLSGVVGQLMTPILWVLVVGPALASAAAVLAITLVQVALVVGLGRLRGAHFDTSFTRLPWFIVACVLLCLTLYGVAETLALRIGRQEAYGPLIPAIGVTPYFLSGGIYPLSVLPAGLEQAAYILPWTHAVALMRYGLMGGDASGLTDIWNVGSQPAAALLSTAVLVAMATVSLTVAARVFVRTTTT